MKGKLFKIAFHLSVVIIGISFLLFLGGGGCTSPASTGSIQGVVVTDNQDSEPLAGVLISAGNISTTSDVSGNYILNKIPVGNREITAVMEGYFSQTKTVEIIENEIVELNFQLIPLSQENKRVVMAELFIAPTCPNCPKAKDAMAQLLEQYGFDKLVILEEYGWDVSEYTSWATTETIDRFKWYVDSLGISRHTPDAYFNGLNQSVHYNESSYNNYKAAIDEELTKAPKINISTSSDVNSTNLIVSINVSIENISSEDLTDLVVGAMIYEDSVYLGSIDKNVNHVVRDIITSEEITIFASGAIQEFDLHSETLNNVKNMSNIHVVVYVQAPDSLTKEILQAAYLE